jgi:hypothetical protein
MAFLLCPQIRLNNPAPGGVAHLRKSNSFTRWRSGAAPAARHCTLNSSLRAYDRASACIVRIILMTLAAAVIVAGLGVSSVWLYLQPRYEQVDRMVDD